ncbi:MAG: hypothetical protein U5N55_04240 [Cypionkella sp.]|nr:hypothetical protein [Cypionkella sp.]
MGKRRGETRRRFFILSAGVGGSKGRHNRMNFGPPFEEAPADMLVYTQQLFRWAAFQLHRRIEALINDESADAKAAEQSIRELRSVLQINMDERLNVEKISKTLAAAAAGDGYDLDSARDEIGRRLSKLRAARSDGGVSE